MDVRFRRSTKSPSRKPEKRLIEPLKKSGGRNNTGRITSRHRGGGHKRFYRIIDFKRNKTGMDAKVTAIEYDPNRSARIALLQYADGEKTLYHCAGRHQGGRHSSFRLRTPRSRRATRCRWRIFPAGTFVHNIELRPGKGAQLARSAGTAVQLMAKEGKFAQLRLPSGEVRNMSMECMATIGMRRKFGPREHQRRQGGPFALARASVPNRVAL